MGIQGINKDSTVSLQNEEVSLTVDAFGGAIIEFRLQGSSVNPLSFRISEDQMPEKNNPVPKRCSHLK